MDDETIDISKTTKLPDASGRGKKDRENEKNEWAHMEASKQVYVCK